MKTKMKYVYSFKSNLKIIIQQLSNYILHQPSIYNNIYKISIHYSDYKVIYKIKHSLQINDVLLTLK